MTGDLPTLDDLEAILQGNFAYSTSGIKINRRPLREAVAGALGVCRNTVDGWAVGKHGQHLPAVALVAEAWLHPEGCALARACELAGGLFVPLDTEPGDLSTVLHDTAVAKEFDAKSELTLAKAIHDGKLNYKEARQLRDMERKQAIAQLRLVARLDALVEGDRD